MKKKNDKPKIRKGFLIVLIFFIVWTLWSWVPVTERIELELLKDSGAGVRIALITDVGEKNINNIVAEWYEDKENVDKMQNRKISSSKVYYEYIKILGCILEKR